MSQLTKEEARIVDKLEAELKVVVQPENILLTLVAIIRRLDSRLGEKVTEFARMENAWRGEVAKLHRQLYEETKAK